MTIYVTANNVSTTLAAASSSSSTTFTLASNANLPTLSAGQVMPLTLNDAATGQTYEIVYVTAISGVTLTVLRAQEGTGAQNWNVGDFAFCAPTAGTIATGFGNPNNVFQVAPATLPTQAVQLQQVGHGQCRLSVASATSLTLKPYNGNNVIVNGMPVPIPSAGLTIANTGLTASTVYYVYLTGTPATPALALSTTGHVTGTNGVEVKNGDATQTLVGMICTNASSQFVDAAAQRFCANWFNRRNVACTGQFGPNTTSSNVQAELSTSNRLQFVTWVDEVMRANFNGNATNTNVGPGSIAQLSIDGSQFGSNWVSPSPIASSGVGFVTEFEGALTEGLHYATLFGATVSSGTSSFQGNSSVQIRI